jgi:hypothetical protein
MMDVDSREAGELEMQRFSDSRVCHVWDGERILGSAFRKTLALERTAWDVYLLYGRGLVWSDATPPAPSFWMHQLPRSAKADPTRLLHPGQFAQKMSELLDRDPTELPTDTALYLHAKGLSRVKAGRPQPQPTLEEVAAAGMSKSVKDARTSAIHAECVLASITMRADGIDSNRRVMARRVVGRRPCSSTSPAPSSTQSCE